MDTATTRPRNSPPAPPPKPKSKLPYSNGSDHQQTSYDENVNNNVEDFYQNNHHTTNNDNNKLNNNHQHYYSSLPPSDEQVVMTPKGKTSNSTVILIERKLVEEVSDRVHVAGGDHQGIIINKDVVKGKKRKFNKFSQEIETILIFFQIKSQQKLHRI